MLIQPKAKGRRSKHTYYLKIIADRIDAIVARTGASGAWVQTVLMADALGIKLDDEYDYRKSKERSRKTR